MVADRKAVDHLAILGGADLNVLRHVPSERGGFVSLGLVMLATAGVAAVSMMFALQHAVLVDIDPVSGLPYPSQPLWISVVSLILGSLWGGLILILDRALVKGMQGVHGRRVWGYFLPRLALALVIGIVVSTPITLRIFQGEIVAEMHKEQSNALDDANNQAANGKTAKALAEKRDAVAAQEKILLGGGVAPSSPEVKQAQDKVTSLTADVAAANGEVEAKRLAMICEQEGLGSTRSECTGVASNQAGKGNLYDAAKSAYDSAVTDLNRKQGELETAKAELATAQGKALQSAGPVITGQKVEARRQLCGKESNPQTLDTSPCHYADNANATGLRAQVAKLERDQSGMVDSAAIRQSGGLLSQLAALTTLSSQNTGAAWAHWMVAALFMLIELLPVLVKTMTAFRGESQYDRVFKRLQDDELDDASQGFDERGADRDREAQKREAIANDMLTRQVELGKMANQIVADEMVGVVTVVLDEWKRGVQDEMRRRAQQAGSAPPQPTAPDPNSPPNPTGTPPFGLPPKATP